MRKSWIKICGTTNYEDALLAWEAGADAIGFIFVEGSKRQITAEQVRGIVEQLARPIERIGVTRNVSLEAAVSLVYSCGLSGLQLHGEEPPDYVQKLRNHLPKARLIKTLHVGPAYDLAGQVAAYQDSGADNFLLDSAVTGASGGGGTCFDWSTASADLARFDAKVPIIIAGGLAPDNVGDAIDLFHPFGVDVASGVEHERGKKDPDKLRDFIHAVRMADTRKVVLS